MALSYVIGLIAVFLAPGKHAANPCRSRIMRVDLLIPGLPAKADHFLFGSARWCCCATASATILFDTGPYRVRPMLVEALAAHGLAPEQIDTVFVSHLHWDSYREY